MTSSQAYTLEQRGLPCSLEAERLSLGAVLIEPDALGGLLAELTPESFSTEGHRIIFDTLRHLGENGEAVDRVSIANEIMRRGQLGAVGGLSYLIGLDECAPRLLNVGGYIRILREKAALRTLCHLGTSIAERAALGVDSAERIATDSAERLTALVATNESGMPETVAEHIERVGSAALLQAPEQTQRGISLAGWPELARLIPVLSPGTLCIVAAPPGGGKTTFAVDLALHASLSGKSTVFISLEMSAEELIRRWVALGAKVNSQHLSKGRLTADEMKECQFQLGELQGLPIRIDAGTCDTPAKMRAGLHKVRRKQPIDLVVIDFLQLVQPGKGGLRGTEAADFVAYQCKGLSREFDCAVVALSQFSNEGLDAMKEGRVSLRYARNSGAIYQACDYGLILYPAKLEPGQTVQESRVPMRLKIDKHRNGPQGEINLFWDKPRYRIYGVAE